MATFDRSVGLSHPTGQITHHIDAERDSVITALESVGVLTLAPNPSTTRPPYESRIKSGPRSARSSAPTLQARSRFRAPSIAPDFEKPD